LTALVWIFDEASVSESGQGRHDVLGDTGNGYSGRGRDALELTRMGDSWEAEVLFTDNA
jgi:hypothetical protein